MIHGKLTVRSNRMTRTERELFRVAVVIYLGLIVVALIELARGAL